MTEAWIMILICGYLLGSIPTGYLMGRANGIDIRQHGSKNIGATNVFRTLGKGPGIFVFLCDTMKGVFAVMLGYKIYALDQKVVHFISPMAGILGGIAVILGHNFPVWLKFKGGKGVATSLGMVIGLVPFAAAVSMAVWLLLLFTTRYVSVASIFAALAVPATVALSPESPDKRPLLIFMTLAALLIVVRHRMNIRRLLNGTENRFEKRKP